MNIDWFSWGYSQHDEWTGRWVLFLLLPLVLGTISSLLVTRRGRYAGSRPAPTTDPHGDWVKNLTFLGAAVTAGAAVIGSPSVDGQEDLGILVASNVVFAALASTHPLLLALSNDKLWSRQWPKEGWTNRMAGAAVLCSALASLTSIAFLVWRSEMVPCIMQWLFTVMFLAAAVLVSWYVKERANADGTDLASARTPSNDRIQGEE